MKSSRRWNFDWGAKFIWASFAVVVFVLGSFVAVAQPQASAANTNAGDGRAPVTIIVSDLGIAQWKDGLEMFGNFSQLDHKALVPLPNRAQILVPMPSDDEIANNPDGWLQQYAPLGDKIKSAIDNGNSTVEVRLVEHEEMGGFLADGARQTSVEKFVKNALHQSLQESAQIDDSSVNLVCGSNGCRSMSRVIPDLSDLDRGQVDLFANFSSQASVDETVKAFEAIPDASKEVFVENQNILGVTADAPGGISWLGKAETVQERHPGTRVFVVDPQLSPLDNIPGPIDWWTHHIDPLKPDRPPALLCEYNGEFCGPSQPFDRDGIFTGPISTNVPVLDIDRFGGLWMQTNSIGTQDTNTSVSNNLSPGWEIVDPTGVPELRQSLQDLRQQLGTSEQDLRRIESELQIEEQKAIADQAAGAQGPGQITIPIPPGWVQCECPAQHPGAGIFVNGVQWHTPALHCQ